ncbi:hypothetical protein [Brevundimonas sp.]|uniref:hypothetical protein n=1 Tax=Brevundimonas sp. TaxID=1871086 RepID=UPI003F6E9AA8
MSAALTPWMDLFCVAFLDALGTGLAFLVIFLVIGGLGSWLDRWAGFRAALRIARARRGERRR